MVCLRFGLLLAKFLLVCSSAVAAPMDGPDLLASHESEVASSPWPGGSSSALQGGANIPSSETQSSDPSTRYSASLHSHIRLQPSRSFDTPLDHESMQILDSLLNDLNAAGRSEDSHAALVESAGSTGAEVTAQNPRKKGTRHWWEPESFALPPNVRPLSQRTGKTDLTRINEQQLRDEVNTKLFAGKLTWVADADMDQIPLTSFRSASPLKKYHRVLPFVHSTGPDGSKLPIRMTEHNNVVALSGAEGSVLRNRPFYLFWSATRTPDGKRHLINYGAAYTDPAHYAEIDDHLRPLIEDVAYTPLAH